MTRVRDTRAVLDERGLNKEISEDRKQQEKVRKERIIEVVRGWLSTPEGRDAMWYICPFEAEFQGPFSSESLESVMYLEGTRAAASTARRFLRTEVGLDLYQVMEMEQLKREEDHDGRK